MPSSEIYVPASLLDNKKIPISFPNRIKMAAQNIPNRQQKSKVFSVVSFILFVL